MNDLRVDGDKSTEVYTLRTSCLIEEIVLIHEGLESFCPSQMALKNTLCPH